MQIMQVGFEPIFSISKNNTLSKNARQYQTPLRWQYSDSFCDENMTAIGLFIE